MPSVSPQNWSGQVGQTPMHPLRPCCECRGGPHISNLDKNHSALSLGYVIWTLLMQSLLCLLRQPENIKSLEELGMLLV